MRQHARPARRRRLIASVRFWILSNWPLQWWFRLPERTRDWWIEEYQRRNGGRGKW